jgi:hypothetical protein
VRADLLDGLMSRATAERDYGVVLNVMGELDIEMTRRLRQTRGSA